MLEQVDGDMKLLESSEVTDERWNFADAVLREIQVAQNVGYLNTYRLVSAKEIRKNL